MDTDKNQTTTTRPWQTRAWLQYLRAVNCSQSGQVSVSIHVADPFKIFIEGSKAWRMLWVRLSEACGVLFSTGTIWHCMFRCQVSKVGLGSRFASLADIDFCQPCGETLRWLGWGTTELRCVAIAHEETSENLNAFMSGNYFLICALVSKNINLVWLLYHVAVQIMLLSNQTWEITIINPRHNKIQAPIQAGALILCLKDLCKAANLKEMCIDSFVLKVQRQNMSSHVRVLCVCVCPAQEMDTT